ncbi:GNAT family N-acetyltransferase [Aestuariicoccus sp. MJ-SS9]|uniref:GNAT family N-acetyltransferase n=1 Tax=Aestuariicoccus sp. MJ-SS9 TaxID=3079855 RepID=UPI00290E868C|nr:GNAT family N-acetyltransferase [Aestuariicoccus sp. MJ-SS9]MDU8910249.1 GNAT family N-acetyltransferase [Aestuariicoccus sp. MJ-SS9]
MSVELKDLGPGDAAWLADQHGSAYAQAEGFDQSFGVLVAEILADFEENRDPACERGWIAWENGARLGSIFCVRQDAETAKLRLFFLVPEARGKGLGKRLLSECMSWAKARGYRRMALWTHESHKAACALYAASGWRCVSSKPVRSFGVDLVEQAWETEL